jgi:hypothetical protein
MGIEHTAAKTRPRTDAPASASASASVNTPGPAAPVPLPVVDAGIGCLRRFTVEGEHKVSANRSLAVGNEPESKDFFALPTMLATSNRILEGLRSRVTLTAGDDAPPGLDGLKKVTPKGTYPEQPMFNSSECIVVASQVTGGAQSHAVFETKDDNASKAVAPLNPGSLPAVNKAAETFNRDGDVGPQALGGELTALHDLAEDESECVFNFQIGDDIEVQTDDAAEASDPLRALLPDKNLRIALLKKIFEDRYPRNRLVQQRTIAYLLRPDAPAIEATEEKDNAAVANWATTINQWIDTIILPPIKASEKASREAVSAAYSTMDPQTKAGRAAKFGVNEFARPDIGESYGTFGTKDLPEGKGDKWNYHFAAVVARDGDDSVTLENFNREGVADGDDMWHFAIHGKEEQSFHNEHAKSVLNGMTVRMGAAATEQMKAEFIQRTATKLGVVDLAPDIRGRLENARTLAELGSIYADATKDL